MVRLTIDKMLEKRGITRYELAKRTEIKELVRTSALNREEFKIILDKEKAKEMVKAVLEENKTLVMLIAEHLFEIETLTKENKKKIFFTSTTWNGWGYGNK